jgi:3-oxoacyl-[acyl-carrier protein] reductase
MDRLEELRGRTALVSGAAGGIGRAIARMLARDGLRLVLVDVDAAALGELAAELDARALPLDVADPDAVAGAELGAIDVLVNNAGILVGERAEATTPEIWRRVLAVNLDGAFWLARACLGPMKARGWGRIVNICSMAMKTGGLSAGTAYTASKGGLGALTLALARETAGTGVTVNGIAPAHVRTRMITDLLDRPEQERLLRAIPMGRFCEPEEVAHAVRFLVHPLAGFVTGEILDINGGTHMD